MARWSLILLGILALAGAFIARDAAPTATANPGAVTFREPAYGLPHIYADTDLELARENGFQIAKDRVGQMVLISRVARGTLYQAFGLLDASTLADDQETRKQAYTSSELNNMFEKMPADVQALVSAYCAGVNDYIDDVYSGAEATPLEIDLLQQLGLGSDLFGNATNISDQVDPNYLAPGGADVDHPDGGFQFTPELAMAIAVLQVRNFGSAGVDEASLLSQLNALLAKYPGTGDEIWDDLNFLFDPLAPVSVPDPTTPGFGGPLAGAEDASTDIAGQASGLPGYDFRAALAEGDAARAHREDLARRLGAWPAMGSYAWVIDGNRSTTSNPWVGGFPQTGIQTPSIMHFVENRSAEGTDHRIHGIGMEFIGAPLILIGQTDTVAWTTTTGALKNMDTYLDTLILEDTDALRYDDEGTPAPLSMRTELIKPTFGAAQSFVVWRSHERGGNGGSRSIETFQGDASANADSATSTSLTDAGAFGGSYAGGYVAIIRGPGYGQMRPILSNTTNTLTLDAGDAWATNPTSASRYVAVRPGNDIIAVSIERAFWMEESTAAFGFSFFQRSEDVLDNRRGMRLIPTAHHFAAADNQAFNGIGTNLTGNGNIAYYASGFWRLRQGGSPTDTRLPMDGTQPDELVYLSGTVGSAGANTLDDTGAFTGEDLSPPAYNYRLDNPTQQGQEFIVTITAGDGYRQTRRIASNDDDTLTLEEDWGVVPSAGDLYEIYEIVAMPEAINPPNGYTSNWNNKAATADYAPLGRQHRNIFIAERLASDSTISRDDLRQLNKDVAGLDGKGDIGRYLIPRIRQAVNAVGNGGNPLVDTVLARLEAHEAGPMYGRNFINPVTAFTTAGEVSFLNSLIGRLSTAIYADELSTTGIGTPGGDTGLSIVQHALDFAAGGPSGAYGEVYTGDYFNSVDWRVVLRDAFSQLIIDLGGVPAHGTRSNSSYVHPLAAIHPNLSFEQTPSGNRGIWEQIVEVGATVLGEFIFPLGQSGFIDDTGTPDANADTLQKIWKEWRFIPMLHVAEDLATDPDGDVDNDGVLDGWERWYFGSISAFAPTSDTDADGLDMLEEYQNATDPTDSDTDDDGLNDGSEVNGTTSPKPSIGTKITNPQDRDTDNDHCTDSREMSVDASQGGRRDPTNEWDYFNPTGDRRNRTDDITAVVIHYGHDDNGDPLYGTQYDRSPLMGGNLWQFGPPNGAIRSADITAAVNSYGHDCFES